MKNANMNLMDLLITKISALYDMEIQLVKAVPKMIKATTDQKLKQGLMDHLEETKGHVTRLEQVFETLGLKPKKLICDGIRGIIKDGEWVIKNVKPAEARDANLIRAAQYVEHYEVAGYTGAIAWAKELGESDVAAILNETLGEEKGSDEDLGKLAEKIDPKAM